MLPLFQKHTKNHINSRFIAQKIDLLTFKITFFIEINIKSQKNTFHSLPLIFNSFLILIHLLIQYL
jgi:hypothetical protein